MLSKAYAATVVNCVDRVKLLSGRTDQAVVVGVDVGKLDLYAVVRWSDGGGGSGRGPTFERPWRVKNPSAIPEFIGLLKEVAVGRSLQVALEPSGTYGDALRQALADAGIATRRVSGKAAHDYAECFDGVPSQHDGKDAAVVAELAAMGKSRAWAYESASEWEQELTYWVEALEAQRRIRNMWLGRIEGLLARHWPEATQIVRGSSGTLLRALSKYGGPAVLAADEQAESLLLSWGGSFLKEATARALVASARATVGVRQGEWERRKLREYAEEACRARRSYRRCRRELCRLAKGHPVLEAQGKAVGLATACVLWVHVGDPRSFDSGAAYRKAMGLNLVERSSGKYKGKLRISKRGSARPRQWLYYGALRMVQRAGVRGWYEAKKARDSDEAKRALVAVMRRLALALHAVSDGVTPFEVGRLFPGKRRRPRKQTARAAARG